MTNKFLEVIPDNISRIRIPTPNDKIYNDECLYSFDTPETDTGLYICLETFFGLGKDHLERHYRKTGSKVYLHIKREKINISSKVPGDGPEKKVTRLAIGVDGGFDPDIDKKKYEIKEIINLVILPDFLTHPWPSNDLPDKLVLAVNSILEAESAVKLGDRESLAGMWDGEIRSISKYAESLVQLENGKRIPPSGWKCEQCSLDNNLWLNLTDGSILCGRQFFDGSGGNNHAIEHFNATRYPLAVKLGTITKDGKGDVFSYDEDDMVEDPYLVKHLSHFGINIAQMEKTDKSMVELELDINQRIGEWATLQENASQLRPVYGPGYTGMINLGNSCYLNSTMQVIFTIPDFVKRFVVDSEEIFNNTVPDPANDFTTQVAKLGNGLLSGKYSKKPPEGSEDIYPNGISPAMFKMLIGKNHPDFSTKRQQDAQEFFLHFISVLQKNSRHKIDPSEALKFQVEDRVECTVSRKVKYTHRTEYCLPLPIPLDSAINKTDVIDWEAKKSESEAKGEKVDLSKLVKPRIKLSSCLEVLGNAETVEQYYSTAINAKTTAIKTTRLSTFPDYLMLHLKKFTLREDWTPIKLDVEVEMPDMIDLLPLKGYGLKPDEELLPEMTAAAPPINIDPQILSNLVEMGFPVEASKKAVYFTNSIGIQEATHWVMQHITDPDFHEPFVPPGMDQIKSQKDSFIPNEDSIAMLSGMGFSRAQAIKALKATDNNLERAADWIFSHVEELDEPMDTADTASPVQQNSEKDSQQYRDGLPRYKLVAFISHMGTSTMVGHYVCHILKDNQWVIFNDEKVAFSENPPKDLGYLYLYEREKA